MSQAKLLAELAPDSLRVHSVKRVVTLDEPTNPPVEQTYLTIAGTPQAYRWLATLLSQLANTADKQKSGTAVIVSPSDLKQVTMTEWSSIELDCTQR